MHEAEKSCLTRHRLNTIDRHMAALRQIGKLITIVLQQSLWVFDSFVIHVTVLSASPIRFMVA